MNLIAYISIIALTSGPVINNNTKISNDLINNVFAVISSDLNIDSVSFELNISDSKFTKTDLSQLTIWSDSSYIISIDPGKFKEDIILMLIHELIHVSQVHNKQMIFTSKGIVYKGRLYTNSVPYNERKYEVEAMQLTEILWQKYRKQFKQL